MATNPLELAALVQRFGRPRILLVGDLMLDEYIYGYAERLSPEAPVPIIQEKYREQRAGGAGNVAAGLATLGAQVVCVACCGQDAQGRRLLEILEQMGAVTAGVLRCPERPTTSKTRLVGLAQHRHPQQMLRLDQEDLRPLTADQETWLLDYIARELPACAAVALEDYSKGLLSTGFCQRVIELARAHAKPVLVDPAFISDYSKYRGAATITPNRYEAERASGLKLQDNLAEAPRLAAALLQAHNLDTCLLTLDRHGMYLLERNRPGEVIPTRPRNVYDVTGAGDMVLAALTMALASGATWPQAAAIANVAGGLEVEKFGIVPITKDELVAELLQQAGQGTGKILGLPELRTELQRRQQLGQKVVFTNGCFDILHAGHVQYLQFARQQGDLLVVGVNTDASTQRLKGPTRPINCQADRLSVLAALAAVDYVIPFDDDTPAALVAALQPDVLVKGADYAGKEVVGRATVEARGGRVVLAPFLEGRSTTATIGKMRT